MCEFQTCHLKSGKLMRNKRTKTIIKHLQINRLTHFNTKMVFVFAARIRYLPVPSSSSLFHLNNVYSVVPHVIFLITLYLRAHHMSLDWIIVSALVHPFTLLHYELCNCRVYFVFNFCCHLLAGTTVVLKHLILVSLCNVLLINTIIVSVWDVVIGV